VTITYTIDSKNVLGNVRMNIGHVTSSSGEATYTVETGLHTVDNFTPTTPFVSGDIFVSYPTSFPNIVDQSGLVVVVVQSGAALHWTAIGRM
jgi:hypothetical protein